MADNYTDTDIESDDIDSSSGEAGDIKSLRRAASGKKKLEEELATARRELAFIKAGINPDDPKMRYFVKGYEGELTSDAVRAAAIEAGFLVQNSADPALAQVAESQQRVISAASGAMHEDVSEAAAIARMEAAMEEGGVEAMLEVARQYGIPIGSEQ